LAREKESLESLVHSALNHSVQCSVVTYRDFESVWMPRKKCMGPKAWHARKRLFASRIAALDHAVALKALPETDSIFVGSGSARIVDCSVDVQTSVSLLSDEISGRCWHCGYIRCA